jgi:nitrogen PTS system EIIA component
MDMRLKDVMDLLNVSERTIYRWIREKSIPAYRIGHQYRFNRAEINEWVLKNRLPVSDGVVAMGLAKHQSYLSEFLRRGGVYSGIKGNSVAEIIRNAIETIATPPGLDKERIATSLIEREELMSTAIGHGIALPHPRAPLIASVEHECLSIAYLEKPTDFHAIDGERVHTMILLFSANSKHHLEALSRIASLCRREAFLELLERKAPGDEVIDFIKAVESEWEQVRKDDD